MQSNQISRIMTRDIVSVEPDSPLKEAVSIMQQRKISFLIIATKHKPLGVLSERDIVRLASEHADPEQLQIKDVMTSPVVTVRETTNIFQVYDILNTKRIRHMVVVDEAGLITGLATLSNIIGGLSIEYFIELKQVDHIMSQNICTLTPDDSVQQALDLMAGKCISCVVITLNQKPVGIITERDITRLYGSDLASDTRLATVMTRPVRSIDAGTFIPQANQLMRDEKLRHLVIIDTAGDLCGLISQSDIARRIEDHYVGYLRTLVKQQNQELQFEHARFAILFEHNPNAVVSCDVDGNIVDINKAYTLLSGYQKKELAGKALESLIHPDDVAGAKHSFKKASDEEAGHAEFRLLNKSGQYTDVFNSFLPIYVDHSLHRIYSVMHDISERKRADKQIQMAEEKIHLLAKAVEAAGDSILITDSNGTIEFVNAAFTRITGYSAAEAIGNKPSMLKSGEQDEQFYAQLWSTITKGEIWHSRLVDRRKNGGFFPAELTISPVCNTKGEITHFVSMKRDLTERETLEEQFRQAQKMEAIGTLTGGIAHDFNNMLAAITGNLYLAKMKAHAQPDVCRKLDAIEEVSLRAANMIQQLLAFSRKDVVDMQMLSFTPFVKEILKFLRSSLPENIALHVDICSETLSVRGDATQLHQVLMNLINNARDAVGDAAQPEIRVSLEAFDADEIWVKCRPAFKPGAYAHLSISDNGCGIADSQVKHLFEPFYTTKEEGKGTGLGLAMVYGVIKTHDGIVEVDSMQDVGTHFHVYLPIQAEPEQLGIASQKQDSFEGMGEHILLVDDEPVMRETVAEVLESMGYRVSQAENGLHGLDVFKTHQQDIAMAILDVVMPVCGGLPLAERIREINPGLPVIFLTGYGTEQLLNDTAQMPATEVISKPAQFEALGRRVRQMLDY